MLFFALIFLFLLPLIASGKRKGGRHRSRHVNLLNFNSMNLKSKARSVNARTPAPSFILPNSRYVPGPGGIKQSMAHKHTDQTYYYIRAKSNYHYDASMNWSNSYLPPSSSFFHLDGLKTQPRDHLTIAMHRDSCLELMRWYAKNVAKRSLWALYDPLSKGIYDKDRDHVLHRERSDGFSEKRATFRKERETASRRAKRRERARLLKQESTKEGGKLSDSKKRVRFSEDSPTEDAHDLDQAIEHIVNVLSTDSNYPLSEGVLTVLRLVVHCMITNNNWQAHHFEAITVEELCYHLLHTIKTWINDTSYIPFLYHHRLADYVNRLNVQRCKRVFLNLAQYRQAVKRALLERTENFEFCRMIRNMFLASLQSEYFILDSIKKDESKADDDGKEHEEKKEERERESKNRSATEPQEHRKGCYKWVNDQKMPNQLNLIGATFYENIDYMNTVLTKKTPADMESFFQLFFPQSKLHIMFGKWNEEEFEVFKLAPRFSLPLKPQTKIFEFRARMDERTGEFVETKSKPTGEASIPGENRPGIVLHWFKSPWKYAPDKSRPIALVITFDPTSPPVHPDLLTKLERLIQNFRKVYNTNKHRLSMVSMATPIESYPYPMIQLLMSLRESFASKFIPNVRTAQCSKQSKHRQGKRGKDKRIDEKHEESDSMNESTSTKTTQPSAETFTSALSPSYSSFSIRKVVKDLSAKVREYAKQSWLVWRKGRQCKNPLHRDHDQETLIKDLTKPYDPTIALTTNCQSRSAPFYQHHKNYLLDDVTFDMNPRFQWFIDSKDWLLQEAYLRIFFSNIYVRSIVPSTFYTTLLTHTALEPFGAPIFPEHLMYMVISTAGLLPNRQANELPIMQPENEGIVNFHSIYNDSNDVVMAIKSNFFERLNSEPHTKSFSVWSTGTPPNAEEIKRRKWLIWRGERVTPLPTEPYTFLIPQPLNANESLARIIHFVFDLDDVTRHLDQSPLWIEPHLNSDHKDRYKSIACQHKRPTVQYGDLVLGETKYVSKPTLDDLIKQNVLITPQLAQATNQHNLGALDLTSSTEKTVERKFTDIGYLDITSLSEEEDTASPKSAINGCLVEEEEEYRIDGPYEANGGETDYRLLDHSPTNQYALSSFGKGSRRITAGSISSRRSSMTSTDEHPLNEDVYNRDNEGSDHDNQSEDDVDLSRDIAQEKANKKTEYLADSVYKHIDKRKKKDANERKKENTDPYHGLPKEIEPRIVLRFINQVLNRGNFYNYPLFSVDDKNDHERIVKMDHEEHRHHYLNAQWYSILVELFPLIRSKKLFPQLSQKIREIEEKVERESNYRPVINPETKRPPRPDIRFNSGSICIPSVNRRNKAIALNELNLRSFHRMAEHVNAFSFDELFIDCKWIQGDLRDGNENFKPHAIWFVPANKKIVVIPSAVADESSSTATTAAGKKTHPTKHQSNKKKQQQGIDDDKKSITYVFPHDIILWTTSENMYKLVYVMSKKNNLSLKNSGLKENNFEPGEEIFRWISIINLDAETKASTIINTFIETSS